MSAEDLVALAVSRGGLGNDALLAAVLPLFHATAAVHERGLVAPLRGLDRITVDEQTRLGFDPSLAGRPVLDESALESRESPRATAVEVVAHRQSDVDLGESGGRPQTTVVEPVPAAIIAPVHVAGWQSWEHVVGHHDQLTDIFSLGQLLIGLGCGLDLSRTHDVARLIDARGNLHALDPALHPVIVSVAARMAEPDRHRRAQDLHSLIEQLENYRDQPLDFDVAAITQGVADRRTAVLRALRDRLFDLSRRNRLINFRPTAQTLNLTEVSVPLMLDVRTIRADQLFTWRDDLGASLLGKPQPLGRWIRYDEAPYAVLSLDKLIATARRDRAEYGQDQLRLVPAFLRWHDLKNDPQTRLASPLVLAKVELVKKRGVRDSYTLRITDPVAEVNPTLRHHLHQLYGINLPEYVDLAEPGALATLHAQLAQEIRSTEPGLQLHLREKPRIDLVRQRAMLKLRNYRRRQHGNAAHEFGGRQYAYSYRRTDYQPLGVQIFRAQLAAPELPLGVTLGGEPRRPAAIETDTYTLDTDGGPYSWDVDLCAVALANFNYRTLGLVRDYDELLATGTSCPSFDQLFSDRPRPISSPPPELPVAERQLVVPADGSQVAAIARAQRGESFVIQGPPGTGKSQTITNMIADFVARGQRVLFVCQKRAALDVVHARLASRGLDDLCTLIHDSQSDKKAFIHSLRDTYESWLTSTDDLTPLTTRRTELTTRINHLLTTVTTHEQTLTTGHPPLRTLLTTLLHHRPHPDPHLSPAPSSAPAVFLQVDGERHLIPSPADWWPARAIVRKLARDLASADPASAGVLARTPLAFITPTRWSDPAIPDQARALQPTWTATATALTSPALPETPTTRTTHKPTRPSPPTPEPSATSSGSPDPGPAQSGSNEQDRGRAGGQRGEWTVKQVRALAELGRVISPLADRNLVDAIDPRSATAQRLNASAADREHLIATERSAWAEASGWNEPLTPTDARSALKLAQSKEGTLFAFLSGDWRRLKSLINTRFDTTTRAVRPTIVELLTDLIAAHDATAAVQQHAEQTQREWGTDDPRQLLTRLTATRNNPHLDDWRFALQPGAPAALLRVADTLDLAEASTSGLLAPQYEDLTIPAVRDLIEKLASAEPILRFVGPALQDLATTPESVQTAVRQVDASPDQLEYAVCAAEWDRIRSAAPLQLSSAQVNAIVGELSLLYDELTTLNADIVVAQVRRRFLTELAHSELSVSGMSPEDRARKKTFATGRRELEHEFGKVMRYRSIRDLASGAPGTVVSLLRPVWLMSPSSVSDTLPLTTSFDVVIYDEASQIPVEEAIPALHRAPQLIVVGDQMQLPPTQYFQPRTTTQPLPTAAHTRPSPTPLTPTPGTTLNRQDPAVDGGDEFEDDGVAEQVGIALTEDSFLSISALRLASTMLTWHYRSRSEALISFSNSAFYQGRLATVPDRLPAHTAPPWTLRSDAPAVTEVCESLLAGSITAVRLVDGVYVRRTNPAEAQWIAGLVRELLSRRTGKSIGIVAFSEAQQGEIERALDELAEADPAFAALYEAEQVRTHGEQDISLFVKNLENVQGDERDIVLMSVCYAAGPDGRMLMNFGPINTSGGEKRLNVIFSRAREHMVVVSSIEPDAITNTYNDGANTLRRFLTYATAISQGNSTAAKAILGTYPHARAGSPGKTSTVATSTNVGSGQAREQSTAVTAPDAAAPGAAGSGAVTGVGGVAGAADERGAASGAGSGAGIRAGAGTRAGGSAVSGDGWRRVGAGASYAGSGAGASGADARAGASGVGVGAGASDADAGAGASGAGAGVGVGSRGGGGVVGQLRGALEGRGVVVETGVGESVFRCDLALKLPGDVGYRVAVLVDTPERVEADSLLERLTTHPRALTATGWRVHHVLTTDWTRSPDLVVDQLVDALHRPTDS
ncbi:AAA domain-containing protein [Kribbella sp. NPDC050470]|uniref:AAA domain-containing protein n=1 Tax=unclassified Kribbella TaxID=2644121 RepID=UPI0037B541C3